MNAPFQFTPQATEDLDAIWLFIAEDNRKLPTALKWKLSPLAAASQNILVMGMKRQDITPLPVRLWTVTKFPNYVVVYRPETVLLQIVTVLHGKRGLREVLAKRPL